MAITDSEKQTIRLLNPWYDGKSIELGIQRQKYLDLLDEELTVGSRMVFLLGSRRVGKTVILLQYIQQLIASGLPADSILYLSMDNTNLSQLDLYSYLTEHSFKYVFLDEVHALPNWAQLLKSLSDLPAWQTKIIGSGSSSAQISDSQAFLSGRSTTIPVKPLSFLEFKSFQPGVANDQSLKDYLFYGGYPKYVLDKQPNYLNELLHDIVTKDIVKIHQIRQPAAVFALCQLLATQIGFKTSARKMAHILELDNKTIESYISHLQEVRLISKVMMFSPSLNQQLTTGKKYYFQDLGMRNSLTGFTDLGSLVENAVYLKLAADWGEEQVTYLELPKGEVDFVVEVAANQVWLVESKYNNSRLAILNSVSKNITQELYEQSVVRRVVVTNGVKGVEEIDGSQIELLPLEEFLVSSKLSAG